MKKPNRKAARAPAKKAAKRTGPSRRTAAERRAIDKRAAIASRDAKREQRVKSKAERALLVRCPSCHAKPGIACFDRSGRQVPTPHRLRLAAAPSPSKAHELQRVAARSTPARLTVGISEGLQPLAPKLAQLVASTSGVIKIENVKIGKRHRKQFGDLKGLAQSINDRGGLIQPIALTQHCELIAGERRMRAWQLSRFAGQPIPCHIIDVDAIVAGEWDENAQRKDFEPSEAVKIKRTLESVMRKLQATRPAAERAAPGRKARGDRAGRTDDKVAKLTGIKRESLRKAEEVVTAAEENPELFGDLQEQMDRTGKINTAHKKLSVRKQRAAIEASPAPLPMNAKECGTWSIDCPWPAELDREQASIDAADRAFRPYPEMSIKAICKFASEQLKPNMPAVVSVWLWVPNYVLVRGYHSHVIAALGFKPDQASTLLTWDKVVLGRGKLLREQTEHAILLRRGDPLVDVFGENPPTTLIRAPRRENSRKPDEFYRLVERVTPARRYASIFSRGGEGEAWDGHGDQVGKFAPAIARAAEAALLGEAKGDAIADRIGDTIAEATGAAQRDEIETLECVAEGAWRDLSEPEIKGLRIAQHIIGKKEIRLTKLGLDRLAELRQAAEAAEASSPAQIDIEEAIAAKVETPIATAALDDKLEIPTFLRRTKAAAGA